MANHFCTITTQSHLYKTRALIQSVRQYTDAQFHVLVIDGTLPTYTDGHYVDLSFFKTDISYSIIKKYKNKNDKLRWALKSVFMLELIVNKDDKIIYVDNDIYFYSSAQFMFDKLNNSDILLTPHYYSFNPFKNSILFEGNFWIGLYNAGFIAANYKAKDALLWWANCCLYNVKISAWRGLFHDQKYLDLLPIIFNNVEILKHKGCNVAGWNLDNCNRKLNTEHQLVIEPNYLLVFIHATPLIFKNHITNKDPLLNSYINDYVETLKKFKPSFNIKNQLKYRTFDIRFFIRYVFWKICRLIE